MAQADTVPRSQTVELRSHPVPPHGQHPQLRVRVSGDIHSLSFEAYWQSWFLAMSEDELRELRDAITDMLDESDPGRAQQLRDIRVAKTVAHGREDGE